MLNLKSLQLKLHCGGQSEKDLQSYRANLRGIGARRQPDSDQFDNEMWKIIQEYALDVKYVTKVKNYLDSLKDQEGRKFSRCHSNYDQEYPDHKSLKIQVQGYVGRNVPSRTWMRGFKRAKSIVMDRYNYHLHPIRYQTSQDVIDAISDWTTSAGFSKIGHGPGRSKKAEIITDNLIVDFERKVCDALEQGSFNTPYLLGIRDQSSGEFDDNGSFTFSFKRKTRPVWMTDVWTVIAERMFAIPLNAKLKDYPYSAIGKNDYYLHQWTQRKRGSYNYWLSLDYSNYDNSLQSWLLEAAFDVLANAFDMTDKQQSLLSIIKEDYIHKYVIMGNENEDLFVHKGTPSGSGLTSIIGGICHEIITELLMDKFQFKANYMVMNDDNLLFIDCNESEAVTLISDISSYMDHVFGMTINVDKTRYGSTRTAPEFLSRVWKDVGPWRHPNVLISKMLFPERFRNYSKGKADVVMVMYSYILGYEAGVCQFLDVGRFLDDQNISGRLRSIKSNSVEFKSLPYNVQLALAD